MQLYPQPPRQSLAPTLIPDDVPVYKILDGKFYADDELFETGSIVVWPDEPNLDMEPLNEMARQRHKEFRMKLDKHARDVAEKNGKSFVSYDQAFENAMQAARNEGKRVTMLNGKTETPIMGAKKKGQRKAQQLTIGEEATVPVMAKKKIAEEYI